MQKVGKIYSQAREKVNQMKQIPGAEKIEYLKRLEDVKGQQLSISDLENFIRAFLCTRLNILLVFFLDSDLVKFNFLSSFKVQESVVIFRDDQNPEHSSCCG